MKPLDNSRVEELTEALRDALPPLPVDAVDWGALHRRITAEAAPLLQRRRTLRPNIWQTLSGWSGRGVPLAAAAAAAVLLLIAMGPGRTSGPTPEDSSVAMFDDDLAAGVFSGSRSLLLTGVSDDEWLDALLLYDEGERP